MTGPEDEFNTDDAYEYAEQDAQRREENMSDENRDHLDDWNERGRELRNWG